MSLGVPKKANPASSSNAFNKDLLKPINTNLRTRNVMKPSLSVNAYNTIFDDNTES
jgi:hypothetical protein